MIKWGNSCLWAKTLAATFPFGLTRGPDLQKPDTRRLIILASQYYYYPRSEPKKPVVLSGEPVVKPLPLAT